MASTLCLQLNHSKSELIRTDLTTREAMLCGAPGLKVVISDSADLLGSPIGNLEGIGEFIQCKSEQLWLLGDRLSLLTLMMPSFFFARYLAKPFSSYLVKILL